MKIQTEVDCVSVNSLNKTLDALSKLMNHHLVASGNSIQLCEKEESTECTWKVKFTVDWEKVEPTQNQLR